MEVKEPVGGIVLGRWCGSQMVPGPQVSKGNQILIRFVSDEYFPSDPGFCIRYTLLHQVRNDSYTMFFLMLMQHLLRAGYVFVENILLIPNDPVLNYISTWLTLNTQCAQDSVLWEIQCTLFNRNRRDMLTWKKRAKKKKRILEVRTILPFYYNASVAVITIPFLWNDLATLNGTY